MIFIITEFYARGVLSLLEVNFSFKSHNIRYTKLKVFTVVNVGRLEVLTAVLMNVRVFLDVTSLHTDLAVFSLLPPPLARLCCWRLFLPYLRLDKDVACLRNVGKFSMREGSFFHRIHTGCGAHPFWCPLGMWPGHEADQFPKCRASFRNAWRCAYAVRVSGLVFSRLKPSGYCCVSPGWTFTDSTFSPHIVFMCCVWISEQTAYIPTRH